MTHGKLAAIVTLWKSRSRPAYDAERTIDALRQSEVALHGFYPADCRHRRNRLGPWTARRMLNGTASRTRTPPCQSLTDLPSAFNEQGGEETSSIRKYKSTDRA
jgi:hypothetical protein